MTRVHIADHHKMLVDGIYSLFDRSETVIVSGVSETLDDCRNALQHEEPDVLLIELSQLVKGDPVFPIVEDNGRINGFYNGIDFCEDVKRHYPKIKIVVLTGYSDWTIVRRMKDIGVSGFILKTSPLFEVIKAIDHVMDGGGIYLCAKSVQLLHQEFHEAFFWATVGELNLMRLLGEGLINKEIAEKLHLAHNTIITKRKLLIQKFGGESTISVLKQAMRRGLIWEDLVP